MVIEPKATHTTPEHEVLKRALDALADAEKEQPMEFTQAVVTDDSFEHEYYETGPYMTLETFFAGVASGCYGPDEDCRWVYIDAANGLLKEQVIKHPQEKRPDNTVMVAYYAA